MKRNVLTFNQFVGESSGFSTDSIVKDILLRNKQKIMNQADISEEIFLRVLDKMEENKPESLDETDIINDAIVYANVVRPEVEAESEWQNQVDGMASTIPQFPGNAQS